jgi:hypothetical protein
MLLNLISIIVYAFLFFIFSFYTFKYNIFLTGKSVDYLNKVSKKLVLVLIFFAAVRSKTGTDYDSYIGIWSGIQPIYLFFKSDFGYTSLEPGFLFFTSFLRTISHSEILFLFCMSFISIMPLYIGLKKINILYVIPGLLFYLFVFYVPYIFNGMRQAVAMGIYIYSLYDIINNKKKNIIILTILAISFHTSGIIIFLSYLIYNLKINHNLYLFLGLIFTLFFKTFLSLQFVFVKLGFNMYYLEGLDKTTTIFQILTRIIILFVLFIFNHIFVQGTSKKQIFNNLLKVYTTGFFFYIYFLELNTFATRINMFFRLLEIILFPIILLSTNKISNKLFILFIMFFLGLYIFISSLSNTDNIYHFNISI